MHGRHSSTAVVQLLNLFIFAEKHKAYHAKNDELAKDGFRKFMKYEHCRFDSCPYSKSIPTSKSVRYQKFENIFFFIAVMNHIHCLKSGMPHKKSSERDAASKLL